MLMNSGTFDDHQGGRCTTTRMHADADGNVFMVGGFMGYRYVQYCLLDKPGVVMLPARSITSLDGFSTFDHSFPFDLAVDGRHDRLVVTACGLGARLLSYDRDANELTPVGGNLPVPYPQCGFSRLQSVSFSPDGGTLYLLNGDLYKAQVSPEGSVAPFEHIAQAPPDDGHFYIGVEVHSDAVRNRFIVNLVDVSTETWLTQFRLIDPDAHSNDLLYSTELRFDATAASTMTADGDRFIALERGANGCVLHS